MSCALVALFLIKLTCLFHDLFTFYCFLNINMAHICKLKKLVISLLSIKMEKIPYTVIQLVNTTTSADGVASPMMVMAYHYEP